MEELTARAGLPHDRVLDVGCGDGALLAELRDRAFGRDHAGVEVAEAPVALARARGLAVERYDGHRLPAADGRFDLAVVSHVLEHVPDPAAVLREAARVSAAVVVEVPLEANLSARRASKRAGAGEIGHLHSFARADVRALVEQAGLRVVAELADPLGREAHLFFARGRRARAAALAKAAARRALFAAVPRLAERLFTVHYACACARP